MGNDRKKATVPRISVHVQTPQRVTEHFVDNALAFLPAGQWSSLVTWTGRRIYIEPQAGAQRMDAEKMGTVGNSDDAIQMILASDAGQPPGRLLRIGALRFRDHLGLGHAMGKEIVMAYGPL